MTTYTFHRAYDHGIVSNFEYSEDCMKVNAEAQALYDKDFLPPATRRYYVHNGVGVIAAFLTRNGVATQILVDDYRQFKAAGLQARLEAEVDA